MNNKIQTERPAPPLFSPTKVNSSALSRRNTSIFLSVLLTFLITAVIFGLGGYYLGAKIPTNFEIGKRLSDKSIYTYHTFSVTYPQTWQIYDSAVNKNFFSKNNLKTFEHFIALQAGDNYLVIGIDSKKSGAEVGGIFTSDAAYQEYLKDHDELTIRGEKFFISKGDTRMSTLTDPNREAGIYTLASVSKYVPNKVTNEQKQTFNGYDDYIQMPNGDSYMIIKLSAKGNIVTPLSIQNEFKQVLETIHW